MSEILKATIVDIKRFAVHDGDGIRTTLFFKGCPLKCKWCHNPESISFQPQISYIEHKCINCGECVKVCSAHTIKEGKHIFDRKKCVACGKCEKVCLGQALKLYGQQMSVDEILPILLEDKDFYDNSNGGITLSGGEPLMQADFCAELLKRLKENGIHTAIDTCGFVSKEAIDKVIPYTDIFLYDIKAINESVHISATQKSNRIILDNLKYIDSIDKKIEVRIPFVPMINDKELDLIGVTLQSLKNLTKVKILPFHNFAGSKYDAIGMENTMKDIKLPTKLQIQNAVNTLSEYGIKTVTV